MADSFFPQHGGAALAEELGINEPKGKVTTQAPEQEIEEEEPETEEEESSEEESELQVPKKFLGKDGKPNWEALSKSYAELEKQLSKTSQTAKEQEKALSELQSWSNNAWDYIQQIKPKEAVNMTQQFVDQNQLNQAQQGKLMEALEKDPEGTLVQMIQLMVSQQLNPVITPLREQAIDTQLDRAVTSMADDPERFPDFWEVKDTMADVIEEFAKDYPDAVNDPRLLKYAYDVARGRSADNLRKQAEEKRPPISPSNDPEKTQSFRRRQLWQERSRWKIV